MILDFNLDLSCVKFNFNLDLSCRLFICALGRLQWHIIKTFSTSNNIIIQKVNSEILLIKY